MAWSGSIPGSFNGTNARYISLRCDWVVASPQDTANKRSTVTLHWIARKSTSSLYTNKANAPWSRSGVSPTSGTTNFNIGNTAVDTDYEFLTQTVVVQHQSDGTATVALSGVIDLSGTSAGVGSFSGSMSLPTIATTPPTASLSISDTWSHPSGIGSTTYVAGYTKFKLTATASATSPATVSTYAFYNGSSLLQSGSASTFTYSSANSAGSYSFKVVVTDSYGNSTTSSTVSATVNAYSTPTITATTFRCNSSGTADGSGTYASMKMSWTVASISGNTATTHTAKLGSTTYTLTNGTEYTPRPSGLSTSTVYTVTYTVTDTIGNTATITQYILSGFINFDLYPSTAGGGMGVGMSAELGYASFGMPIKIYKGIKPEYHATAEGIGTLTALNNALLSYYSSLPDYSFGIVIINPSASFTPFNGAVTVFKVFRANANYGTIEGAQYAASGGINRISASVYAGAITNWATAWNAG